MVKLTRGKQERARSDECRRKLLELLKPGDTLHTVLRHVSDSRMIRRVDVYKLSGEDFPLYLSGYIEGLGIGFKRDKKGQGLIVHGCGMDMGFALVYQLSAALWPASTPESHGTCNGNPDSDGGCALKQHWL